MPRGLFISFEGIDGVGKSTQVALLAEHLAELGRPVFCTREPGGTELGDEIRALLLHGKGHVDARAEALLYAADRAQHVSLQIEPALARGEDVITDRYLDSSVAYQGAGRELGYDEVRALSMFAVNGLLPDLTVLLDLSAEQSTARLAGTELDRLEREKVEFFEAVRQGFLTLAAAEPKRWLVLDANRPVTELAGEIRNRVTSLLSK